MKTLIPTVSIRKQNGRYRMLFLFDATIILVDSAQNCIDYIEQHHPMEVVLWNI